MNWLNKYYSSESIKTTFKIQTRLRNEIQFLNGTPLRNYFDQLIVQDLNNSVEKIKEEEFISNDFLRWVFSNNSINGLFSNQEFYNYDVIKTNTPSILFGEPRLDVDDVNLFWEYLNLLKKTKDNKYFILLKKVLNKIKLQLFQLLFKVNKYINHLNYLIYILIKLERNKLSELLFNYKRKLLRALLHNLEDVDNNSFFKYQMKNELFKTKLNYVYNEKYY